MLTSCLPYFLYMISVSEAARLCCFFSEMKSSLNTLNHHLLSITRHKVYLEMWLTPKILPMLHWTDQSSHFFFLNRTKRCQSTENNFISHIWFLLYVRINVWLQSLLQPYGDTSFMLTEHFFLRLAHAKDFLGLGSKENDFVTQKLSVVALERERYLQMIVQFNIIPLFVRIKFPLIFWSSVVCRWFLGLMAELLKELGHKKLHICIKERVSPELNVYSLSSPQTTKHSHNM